MILQKPIASYVRITQRFTPPTHYGLDLSAYVGTAVYAPCDGVAHLGDQGAAGFGPHLHVTE